MCNTTSIPLQISLLKGAKSAQWQEVGICGATAATPLLLGATSSFNVTDGILSKPSRSFGIPVANLDEFSKSWRETGAVDIIMKISPNLSEWAYPDQSELQGRLDFHAVREILKQTDSQSIKTKFDVQCRAFPPPEQGRGPDAFVVQVTADLCLVGNSNLFLDIRFDPRSIIVNNMPVPLSIRTPMPHTTSTLCQHDKRGSIHELSPGDQMEVFTPGPSIAVNIKCADMPIAGLTMEWMENWIDLPLTPEFGLSEPLQCVFPFQRKTGEIRGGCEFFIADGNTDFGEFFHGIAQEPMQSQLQQKRPSTASSYGLEVVATRSDVDAQRKFFVTICNYAVDHTGSALLERFYGFEAELPPLPYSTFASQRQQRRTTLLPRSSVPFRLLHLTMDGDEGIRRTLPFKIDNIAICEGGISSTPIPWDDNTQSGYMVYRRLVTTDQSELHIIPEFIVFNGSEVHTILVRQPGYADVVVPPGTIKPVWIGDRDRGLILSLEYLDIGGFTPPLRVDNLGLRVAVLKSFEGHPLGSIAIQTVIGAQDSRFVVKIGDIKRGSLDVSSSPENSIIDMQRDFLRFRIQASELEITLNECKWGSESSRGDRLSPKIQPGHPGWKSMLLEKPVTTFVLQRFTVDWQRVFKDEDGKDKSVRRSVLLSPERSQLSLVIHSILVKDESKNTAFPIVFNSTSTASFLDLCIRIRGPMGSDLIKVDLVDVNLAHINGMPQKMFLNTSEDFVWKLLDLFDRISVATGELASTAMQLKWDVEHGGYVISFDDNGVPDASEKYTPPRTGSIYDINKARVSPFTLILSFKRNPQASRYSNQNAKGSQIVKYFTQRLKFTIDNADLTFSSYETTNLKGPSDRLIEVLQAVYMSRIKFKLVTIMTSASFQDWKSFASRSDGDDSFQEGDLLRMTGNLAGKTANMVFKGVGKNLGKSVARASFAVGNTFEHATGVVGARQFGAGVNSIVSGVGGGIGDGLSGGELYCSA